MNDSRIQLFIELLTANQARIRRFILSLVPNLDDADDIMQETSKMMWSKFEEYQPGTAFLAWGFQVAYYRILEYRRNRKKTVFLDENTFKEIAEESKRSIDIKGQMVLYLEQCIRKLKLSDQLILQLKYRDNMKGKEISKQVGKSVDSTYKDISKIHELLRRCIKRTVSVESVL